MPPSKNDGSKSPGDDDGLVAAQDEPVADRDAVKPRPTSDSDHSRIPYSEIKGLCNDALFTTEQLRAIRRCNIRISDDGGKYSESSMARAIECLGEPPLEVVGGGGKSNFAHEKYCVSSEATETFFERDMYNVQNGDGLAYPDPGPSEEAILLEIEAIRRSAKEIKTLMFRKNEKGVQVIFGMWWMYALQRLVDLDAEEVVRGSLGDYTAVMIMRSLFALLNDAPEVLWRGMFQHLKTTCGVDWPGTVEIARRVINGLGPLHDLLDGELSAVEACVQGLKLGPGKRQADPASMKESIRPTKRARSNASQNPGGRGASGHMCLPTSQQTRTQVPPVVPAESAMQGSNSNQPGQGQGGEGNLAAGNESTDSKDRHKRQRLWLLHHTSKCSDVNCTVTPCAMMKSLWPHLKSCTDVKCTVKHCSSSRSILRHYKCCKKSPCTICDPVRQKYPHNTPWRPPITNQTMLRYDAPWHNKPLPPGLSNDSEITAPDSVCRPLTFANDHKEMSAAQCSICMDPLLSDGHGTIPVRLKKCSHSFHLHCIRKAFNHQCSFKCPECHASTLTAEDHLTCLRGNMPSGNMSYRQDPSVSCAGFEDVGSLVITYTIQSSMQKQYHPNPRQMHGSAYRVAYLPDNQEGRDLLSRLKAAFLCGLTFTIGTSLTTNIEHSVTWASIHHKTSPSGGAQCHGFPDANYLTNCNRELDMAGIPNAQICASHAATRETNVSGALTRSQQLAYLPKIDRCCYKESVRSLSRNENASNPLSHFSSIFQHIYSDEFAKFVQMSGLINHKVEEANPHLLSSGMYQAFVEEASCCPDDHDVRIVFHGTPEANIESILSNGLDPALRNRQALGQGEYFANSPNLPLGYCRGGLKMLIFAVITTTELNLKIRDIVVVEERERQLPIATLSFDGFIPSALNASYLFQSKVAKLLQDVQEKEKLVKEVQTKEKIIRFLVAGEPDAASEAYNKACDDNGVPPKSWAQEIATYVWDHIRDKEMVEIYFPNLPDRPMKSDDVPILNSEKCKAEADEAKKKYDKMTKKKK